MSNSLGVSPEPRDEFKKDYEVLADVLRDKPVGKDARASDPSSPAIKQLPESDTVHRAIRDAMLTNSTLYEEVVRGDDLITTNDVMGTMSKEQIEDLIQQKEAIALQVSKEFAVKSKVDVGHDNSRDANNTGTARGDEFNALIAGKRALDDSSLNHAAQRWAGGAGGNREGATADTSDVDTNRSEAGTPEPMPGDAVEEHTNVIKVGPDGRKYLKAGDIKKLVQRRLRRNASGVFETSSLKLPVKQDLAPAAQKQTSRGEFGELHIRVVSARDIKDVDAQSEELPAPYIFLQYGGQRYATRTMYGSKGDASWDELATFSIYSLERLKLKLRHTTGRTIGEAQMELTDFIINTGNEVTVTVTHPDNGSNMADVNIEVKIVDSRFRQSLAMSTWISELESGRTELMYVPPPIEDTELDPVLEAPVPKYQRSLTLSGGKRSKKHDRRSLTPQDRAERRSNDGSPSKGGRGISGGTVEALGSPFKDNLRKRSKSISHIMVPIHLLEKQLKHSDATGERNTRMALAQNAKEPEFLSTVEQRRTWKWETAENTVQEEPSDEDDQGSNSSNHLDEMAAWENSYGAGSEVAIVSADTVMDGGGTDHTGTPLSGSSRDHTAMSSRHGRVGSEGLNGDVKPWTANTGHGGDGMDDSNAGGGANKRLSDPQRSANNGRGSDTGDGGDVIRVPKPSPSVVFVPPRNYFDNLGMIRMVEREGEPTPDEQMAGRETTFRVAIRKEVLKSILPPLERPSAGEAQPWPPGKSGLGGPAVPSPRPKPNGERPAVQFSQVKRGRGKREGNAPVVKMHAREWVDPVSKYAPVIEELKPVPPVEAHRIHAQRLRQKHIRDAVHRSVERELLQQSYFVKHMYNDPRTALCPNGPRSGRKIEDLYRERYNPHVPEYPKPYLKHGELGHKPRQTPAELGGKIGPVERDHLKGGGRVSPTSGTTYKVRLSDVSGPSADENRAASQRIIGRLSTKP